MPYHLSGPYRGRNLMSMTNNAPNSTAPHQMNPTLTTSPPPSDWKERATITVPQAATVLGVSRSSAYEAVHRHSIPTVRIGRRLLVPVGALLDLLNVGGPRG